jgi:hypothetical protein
MSRLKLYKYRIQKLRADHQSPEEYEARAKIRGYCGDVIGVVMNRLKAFMIRLTEAMEPAIKNVTSAMNSLTSELNDTMEISND